MPCAIGGSLSTSGKSHGSLPGPMAPSPSRITGERVSIATRAASYALSKQSAGERAASTGTGHSPLRP